MPIYDRDAVNTMYEIKEVRDWDATNTSHIIKEVRDYDATNTSHIIYTSEAPLLNFSDEVTASTGGWAISSEGSGTYLKGYIADGKVAIYPEWPGGWYFAFDGSNYYGRGWMTTKNKIAFSGNSKLKLTFFYHRGYGDATKGSGFVYIALVTDNTYAGGNVTSNIMQGGNVYKSKVLQCSEDEATTTLELDVSGVTGSYYVQIGRWNKTAYCVFTNAFQTLILE